MGLSVSHHSRLHRSIDLSAPVCIHLSIDLSIYLPLCVSIYPSIYRSICPCVYPSIHRSIDLSAPVCIHLSIDLSACLLPIISSSSSSSTSRHHAVAVRRIIFSCRLPIDSAVHVTKVVVCDIISLTVSLLYHHHPSSTAQAVGSNGKDETT